MTNTMKITHKQEKTQITLLHLLQSMYISSSLLLFTKAHVTFKMSTIFKKVKPLVSLCIRWWHKVIIFIFQVLEKK